LVYDWIAVPLKQRAGLNGAPPQETEITKCRYRLLRLCYTGGTLGDARLNVHSNVYFRRCFYLLPILVDNSEIGKSEIAAK
jgi:hypothetical protein